MLSRLLESKARRNRSPFGLTVSISAHLAVVVAAIHATAESRPRAPEAPSITVVPVVPERRRAETQPEQRITRSTWPLPHPVRPSAMGG